ncbi:PaaX family transcriptional regulator [Luteipulveratus flavus]|uniref:PaaX family transcriptional regulator C-terminal domain-containing protein n=1 Tax=Luteipulveratus flavus TaxID=3031728 RepID=A0ABT6C8F0_9MICO|nr:PaaX family transcriptional regulator C-terminal domain-containing protein [Luteipulveratus sp. YIM 133296]MDF8264996.1 PaaX family transcriptional regulator C-terminal domain-containing protein [Luteipulveratus sp. YIM 133296]
MHARAAVFDLYGDHLAARGGWAPIASVVRLLAAVDVAAPAVRTAVSRLSREGWLEPEEREGIRGYAATPRAERRLRSAWDRIYRTTEQPWNGTWHVVVCEHVADRRRRDRISASLGYLGYARMAADTWVGPRVSGELDTALEGQPAHSFEGRLSGDGDGLARDLWDLQGLARAYDGFIRSADRLTDEVPALTRQPEQAFAVRTDLVHEWRKFLFSDPGLPAQVLPADWPGHAAAQRFDRLTQALRPAASTFVDACLAGEPDATSPARAALQSSD